MAKSIEDRFIDQLNNYLGQHLLKTNVAASKIYSVPHVIQKRLALFIIQVIEMWSMAYEDKTYTLVPIDVAELGYWLNGAREQWQTYGHHQDLPYNE